jgi:hypothetical protein
MSSTMSQWWQNLADSFQRNRFLEYQVNTGLFGIPVATFGLVTIAAAVFVHATFSDELSAMGTRVYEAAEQGVNKATELAETAQVAISEQANRMGEAVSKSMNEEAAPPPRKTEESPPPPPEEPKSPVEEKKEGGRRRRRRTSRKRT